MKNNKVFIVSNSITGLISFRIEVIEAIINQGFELYILAPYEPEVSKLKSLGCNFYDLKMKLHGKNIFEEMRLVKEIFRIIKIENPKFVLTYTIKPNIYVGLINRIKKDIVHIPNITGFGHSINSPKYKCLGDLMLQIYVWSIKNAKIIFTQNKSIYIKVKQINKNTNCAVLPGSGVNLNKYYFSKMRFTQNYRVITYLGRPIKNKGITELVESIKEFNNCTLNYEYIFNIVVTSNFDNPEIHNLNIISRLSDVRGVILNSHVIINPSYHEGMSNILLEGASMGRFLMASDVPGCREIVKGNGILFEKKSTKSLLNALLSLDRMTNQELQNYGLKAREHVENTFDRQIIIDRYLEILLKVD